MTQPNQTGMIKKQKASVAAKEQPTTIKGWIKSYEGEVAKALPSVMTPERHFKGFKEFKEGKEKMDLKA